MWHSATPEERNIMSEDNLLEKVTSLKNLMEYSNLTKVPFEVTNEHIEILDRIEKIIIDLNLGGKSNAGNE